MTNRLQDFQRMRMIIFGELVKRYWNNQLSDINDLNRLTKEIKEQFNFQDKDIGFIRDHIRVAMGLDPKGNQSFNNELNKLHDFEEVHKPIITKIDGMCQYCDSEDCQCIDSCKYEAHVYRKGKGLTIKDDKCLDCGQGILKCKYSAIADKIEFMPLIDLLKDRATDVYATVAPAIVGQFGDNITIGQIRSALKLVGFKDMLEVALFADILTIREAYEFNNLVKNENDFFLTSCCCPVWFNLVKRNYPQLFSHMSPSISPMIASGRLLKKLYSDIKVVFIGPCVAKKSEAKESQFNNDIDFVLTFRELEEIFNALEIDLASLPNDDKDQASFGGRVYARTGGVSFSVKTAVNRIDPSRLIKLRAKKVDGVKKCRAVLDQLSKKHTLNFNFLEGMGCIGGCVGGPRTNIDRDKAKSMVNEFAEESLIMTPFDNLNIRIILRQLGVKDLAEIYEGEELSELLARKE